MYDNIETYNELIEYLTISPATDHNGKGTSITISRSKAELECERDLIMKE